MYSYKHLFQKIRSSQINNLKFYLKKLDNKEQTKSKASRRKERIKIRADINEINKKQNNNKSVKPQVGSLKRLTKLTTF